MIPHHFFSAAEIMVSFENKVSMKFIFEQVLLESGGG